MMEVDHLRNNQEIIIKKKKQNSNYRVGKSNLLSRFCLQNISGGIFLHTVSDDERELRTYSFYNWKIKIKHVKSWVAPSPWSKERVA